MGWPCSAERLETAGILPVPEIDYGPTDWACTTRPVIVHDDGSAEPHPHAVHPALTASSRVWRVGSRASSRISLVPPLLVPSACASAMR